MRYLLVREKILDGVKLWSEVLGSICFLMFTAGSGQEESVIDEIVEHLPEGAKHVNE